MSANSELRIEARDGEVVLVGSSGYELHFSPANAFRLAWRVIEAANTIESGGDQA